MSNKKDYATGTVAVAPSPQDSGLTLELQTGEGARQPTTPYYATAHPPSEFPTLDNAEKIQVTDVTGDVLTFTRGEGDTSPMMIDVGWRISNSVFEEDFNASEIPYDNTGSGATADDVQDAIDEAFSEISATNAQIAGLTQDDIPDGSTYVQFAATQETKLAGIEAGADVTDATNVAAAGAVMETDTSTADMDFVLDEDDMSSDSDEKLATQQSIKAYVDAAIAALTTDGQLPVTGDIWPQAGPTIPTGWLLCDGSAVSRSTYADLFAELVKSKGTFTITIASPGVVTLSSHGLLTGDSVYITTTGALPTGLSTNTRYFVIFVSSSTFRLATTLANAKAGTAINTSGTQSGTHTMYNAPWGIGDGTTTFNIPDLRQRTLLGKSASGTGQALGEYGGAIDHRHKGWGQGDLFGDTGNMIAPIGAVESDANKIGYLYINGNADPNTGSAPTGYNGQYRTTGTGASSSISGWNHSTIVVGYTSKQNPPFASVNFRIKT